MSFQPQTQTPNSYNRNLNPNFFGVEGHDGRPDLNMKMSIWQGMLSWNWMEISATGETVCQVRRTDSSICDLQSTIDLVDGVPYAPKVGPEGWPNWMIELHLLPKSSLCGLSTAYLVSDPKNVYFSFSDGYCPPTLIKALTEDRMGICLSSLQEYHEGRADAKILLCFVNSEQNNVYGFVPNDPLPLYRQFQSYLANDGQILSPKPRNQSVPMNTGVDLSLAKSPAAATVVKSEPAVSGEGASKPTTEKDAEAIKNSELNGTCVICLDETKPVCFVFLKCLHLCLCADCGPAYAVAKRENRRRSLINVICPVCQKYPNQMRKVFFS